ncbi:glycerol-3-phosphate dehydrogenase [Polymorphobacter fuscus]|uniref:Glycerol-3-phosphate dehydrogenase n=1 Tax=Sandarakinorhabdus fusca TaxID=1439888 RepID=A0A7C9KH85_9SPHN|nr:glycerol-3-phosphate dehydrogenase [Polymorphobacter fuscus]KAB7649080.1 glycerol-3-phosphate dehydrogenase [Polymorphobacter fuscus]MQT16179.1 glycerol-3-phosphate dehydrogenase [Polymorphobacter fuscus]
MHDLLIIGGGINGAGIARDAAGRGLSVALVEAGDLGGATSSASTKLIHGGLRYLEFHAYGLVRKALAEREVLLDIAPHIAWPQSFVLPNAPDQRPEWMLRAGLFLYDHLARRRIVHGSARIDLRQDPAGRSLAPEWNRGFRYWDGWVDDARLVIANLQDARDKGALVLPRTRAIRAEHDGSRWAVTLGDGRTLHAARIVNAAGPWAESVARSVLGRNDAPALRLVQGSHIITRRVSSGADAFMFQQPDGRIIFVIPYERDFSLIGTTERDIDTPDAAHITEDETDYLLAAANRYLARPLTRSDVTHRFSGVRPLILEANKGDRETTRDYRLVAHDGVPAMTVVGGKITTYRVLAEDVLQRIAPASKRWTATAPLPGSRIDRKPGETGQDAFARWLADLTAAEGNYDPRLVRRLAHTIGTAAAPLLAAGLGANIGGMFEAELDHFVRNEWATTADDVLWRRTKMGLHIDNAGRAEIAAWFGEAAPAAGADAPVTHRFAAKTA